MSKTLLEYKGFGLEITKEDNATGSAPLISGVSFAVYSGKVTTLIGLSGSGKTMCANAALKLWPNGFNPITHGEILFSDNGAESLDLCKCSEKEMQLIRGRKIGFVFQESGTTLNPTKTIHAHIVDTLVLGGKTHLNEALIKSKALFNDVGLVPPEHYMNAFPHQLSGGQKQRVLIALAICLNPSLVIADEPTSSLDALTQLEIMRLFKDIATKQKLGILFITHNINIVQQFAETVVVMDNGTIVESGLTSVVLPAPKSRAAKQLIENRIPQSSVIQSERIESHRITLLEAENISVQFSQNHSTFDTHSRRIEALKQVNLCIKKGISTGIVGESGSGKSTLIRCFAGLIEPQQGLLRFEQKALSEFNADNWQSFRRKVQIVFQDSSLSLNPLLRVEQSLLEAIRFHNPQLSKTDCSKKLLYLLDRVHLSTDSVKRMPHQLSGGQRQRCCIVRALSSDPVLLLFDEAVSSLDTSTQFQILNLIAELKKENDLAIAFVSHDIEVVRYICDEIAVMKNGQIVETGSTSALFTEAQSDYTRLLISSALNAIA
jgi:ABC-type glutathione transport system ATPase component